jgi:dihydrolipoamide dehydrogenase
MSEDMYDLIILGGGPAGYAAGIRAGQLGKKAVVIEMERAGGTCLNWGCIPSKALLKSAETYQSLHHAEDLGISCGDISFDFEKIIQRSRGVADQMGGGIEFLFKKNKVDYIVGKGKVRSAGEVEITEGEDAGKVISGSKIMIATGCKPRTLDEVAVDGERVMTSREALAMKKQPKSIAIMGAGAIGAEFAYFLNAFGTKVTLVEMLPNILPVEDKEVSDALLKSFNKQGIDCRTGTRIDNIEVKDESVLLSMAKGDDTEQLEVESLLLAIGVVPNLDGAVSEDLNLELNRGYLKGRRKLSNIYSWNLCYW